MSSRRKVIAGSDNRQRIHEAVATVTWLRGERLKNNRITFAIRFETRVRGCLHQFRRYKDFARVIDLDNHFGSSCGSS
jgi:hypothetical protein